MSTFKVVLIPVRKVPKDDISPGRLVCAAQYKKLTNKKSTPLERRKEKNSILD